MKKTSSNFTEQFSIVNRWKMAKARNKKQNNTECENIIWSAFFAFQYSSSNSNWNEKKKSYARTHQQMIKNWRKEFLSKKCVFFFGEQGKEDENEWTSNFRNSFSFFLLLFCVCFLLLRVFISIFFCCLCIVVHACIIAKETV